MDKKSIWEDGDCTGVREIQMRKQFYGHSAVSGKACPLGGGIDINGLANTLTTSGLYEEVNTGFVHMPVSRFYEKDMRTHDNYSDDNLKYLDKGLEAFDIY